MRLIDQRVWAGRKWLLFHVAICVAYSQGITDPGILADKHIIEAEGYAKNGEWTKSAEALSKVEKLESQLSGSLPVEYYLRLGSAYARAYSAKPDASASLEFGTKGTKYLTKYINATGREAPAYREALELLTKIEKLTNAWFDKTYRSAYGAAEEGSVAALIHYEGRDEFPSNYSLLHSACGSTRNKDVFDVLEWLHKRGAKPTADCLSIALSNWNMSAIHWLLHPAISKKYDLKVNNPNNLLTIIELTTVLVKDRPGLDRYISIEIYNHDYATISDWYTVLGLYRNAGGAMNGEVGGRSVWWNRFNTNEKHGTARHDTRINWVNNYLKTSKENYAARYYYSSRKWEVYSY
ncbi:MAG: hypothetical protein SGI88_11720 [Candidatus Hydrogenedentes bacterium]|nr:hypothetical protein [Candidatus Hydrogenedentota bacterium]